MPVLREIETIFEGSRTHWVGSGFKVSNYFPSGKNLLERFSPFILMDYNIPIEFPPSKTPKGIGPHPHRGFETVTFAFEGAVEHHDNKGNHGVIYPGDVQWMTAGSGILHKEYHEEQFRLKGGIFHVIQLWVNLPKKYKMVEPRYQAITKEDMGKIVLPDEKGNVIIVAGTFNGVEGPAKTFSPMNIYTVEITNNTYVKINEPSNFNMGILVLDGEIKINKELCKAKDFILFKNEDGDVNIEGISENAKVFILSGEPINEPIAAGGPFVMNTKEELSMANEDFNNGKFGTSDF
ncbi:pirin family protein [Tissierella sp.]|uniref:pirin family protein n=1 Tax=Tissierella sp. TaxID=41274 RepID=UPI002864AB10|nr:pirin family protein [Tissierella sp.]MDR7855959.1 pirin family protein [Tissierella sp.]